MHEQDHKGPLQISRFRGNYRKKLEVLKGSENTIKSFKPVIFIEIAKIFSSRNFINLDYQVTLNWFKKNGYFIKRFNHYGKFVNPDKGTVPDGVSMY